jgi:hypothetical protein
MWAMASSVAASAKATSSTFWIVSYPGPVEAIARAKICGSANSATNGTSIRSMSTKPYRASSSSPAPGSAKRNHGGLVLDLRRGGEC